MDEKENGVATDVNEGIEKDLQNDGQHSQKDQGTGDDSKATLDNKENGGEGGEGGEGEGGDEGAKVDPKDQRINNLMSNWQSEASSHNKTKSELNDYKQKFGEIDIEQKVADKGEDVPESFKPGWKPETTEDIQQAIKESAEYGARQALGTIEKSSQARKDAETAVDNFIGEVKEADPEFDEKEFYGYANKHHFPLKNVNDLRAVYSSYYEMQKAIAVAGKTAIKNKEGRDDKVNKPGSGEGSDKGADYEKIHGASSSADLIHDHFHS